MDEMNEMYLAFKDIAEFRLVYVREAHAADGKWSGRFARDKGITEHKDYGERCMTAEMMMAEKNVTIPCIIDDMDNGVNDAYNGWPTRVYLVRKDGRLGVAAKQGPWGLKPGLTETLAWLEQYRKTGEEPPLPD